MQEEDREFEAEVRRVAGNLWSSDELGGRAMIDGRERDGLYVTEDVVNLVEATTSRSQQKAQGDIDKIVRSLTTLRRANPDKSVKGWFITKGDPTADQVEVARKYRGDVVAESLERFRRRLIDTDLYLKLRMQYPFGSATDPETNSRIKLPEYLPLDVLESGTETMWSIDMLADLAYVGGRYIILGDFGAGKSMTMRQVFIRLRRDFARDGAPRMPVHLNLRDHHGQDDPAEALERHARLLGFPTPHHIVRAWRSGSVDLLLDGFDELGSPGWMGSTKRMGAVRHAAAALVRNLIQQAPVGTSVVVAGRQHFFDSTHEMRSALGLAPSAKLMTLNEFSDEQVGEYLRKRDVKGPIPEWLPGRPLLLAYLAARGFLTDLVASDADLPPAESWDRLLDRICEREAAVDVHLDGSTVRLVIERLATAVRTTSDGLGPISFEDMTQVFKEVCGYAPDDRGMVLLQRLPGLGLRDDQFATRQFIDDNLADTARAGDVCNFLMAPYVYERRDAVNWGIGLGNLGVDVVVSRIAAKRIPAAVCAVAIAECEKNQWMMLAADVVRVAIAAGVRLGNEHTVFIKEVEIPLLELDQQVEELSSIEFQDSIFRRLEIDRRLDGRSVPRFVRCLFGVIEGRVGVADLPPGRFVDCQIEEFADSTSTTAGIMNLDLTPKARVALTILKKLYLQRGSGRKEAALFRGLDPEARQLVPQVLQLIERHDLLKRVRTAQSMVFVPVRSSGARVRRMLSSPTNSDDPLLAQCREL